MPKHLYLPELVTEHEYGHQYWYGMVATNEFEEAWLDEGINSYTEVKVLGALYGTHTSAINFRQAYGSDAELQRTEYVSKSDYDPLSAAAWKFVNSQSYGAVTYGKTASVLMTLESIVGEDTMRRILRTYFTRYRFTHPTGTDFINIAIGVSGRDELDEYFKQAVYGTAVLDYAVDDAYSEPVDWWKPGGGSGQYRSVVQLHRKGEFILPVTLEVRFSNGEVVRENWDGANRWTRFTYLKAAKVVSAEIDPDHQVWLDTDVLNNSFTVASDGRATRKLANWWMFTTQLAAQWAAWIV
jgi:aminopeptidase N